MTRRRFEPSEAAARDVAAYLGYLREHSLVAAQAFEVRLESVIASLVAGEFEGPFVRLKTGERVQTWPVYPLRIYYQRRGDVLFVVRFHHGSKRPIERTSRRQAAAPDSWPWPPREEEDE